jgi:hypothetical protein
MQEAIKRGGALTIAGLFGAMAEVYKTSKEAPVPWGLVAVEKNQLRKPGRANIAKKKTRKRVEASRRGNR